MNNIQKAKTLLNTIKAIATFLTEEETNDIGRVLLRAMERMEKEEFGMNANTSYGIDHQECNTNQELIS